MYAKSIVISSKDNVTIKVKSKGTVHFDGAVRKEVKEGDEIRVKKSENTFRVIKLSKKSFMEVLHKKMEGKL
jgi:NAD+ kinase